MNNMKTTTRLLSLLLTLVMVVSVFVAVPVSAAEEVSTAKTVLWSHDFATDGNQDKYSVNPNKGDLYNAKQSDYDNGYFAKNDIFYLGGLYNSNAYVQDGKFYIGYSSRLYSTLTKGSNPNADFYSLLQGTYEGYNTVGSSYFFETDFYKNIEGSTSSSGTITAKSNTKGTWTYTDENGETVTGSGTIYSDYGNGVGGQFFWYRNTSNEQQVCLFRVSSNGLLYASDNTTSDLNTLVKYGGVYYLNANGEKVYLPKDASATGTLAYCIKEPSKAYQVETGVKYRIGIEFKITKVVVDEAAGTTKVTSTATSYIKKAGEANWTHCIGTSTHTETLGIGDYIELNSRAYATLIGGVTEFYTYNCDGTNHLNVLATAQAVNPDRYDCVCLDCERSWQECYVDGVRYKGLEYGTTCEGTYIVWVPQDGIGSTFAESIYSEVGKGHSYNSYGECTVCGKYEYVTEMPEGYIMSGKPDSKTNITNYSSSRKDIKISNSGVIYMEPSDYHAEIGTSVKPITVSFDFKLESSSWNTTLGSFAELLSLQPGTGTGQQVIQMGMDGNNRPFLSFPTDFQTGQAKTYEKVTIALVDGVEDKNDANYEKLEAYKDYYGRNCGGFAWTTADSGSTRTYTFYNHNVGSYYLTVGEWINIQVTIIPNSVNNMATVMLYVNGELVGMRVNQLKWQSAYHAVRWNPGATRYTKNYYYIDNLGLRIHDTVEEAYTNTMASNDVFTYRFDRFQTRLWDANFSVSEMGGARSSAYPLIGRFEDNGFDNVVVYGSYAHYDNPDASSSDRITIGTSTKVNGEYTHLSENPYEINLSFAIPEEVAADIGTPALIRLSKYFDSYVKLVLVTLQSTGYAASVNGSRRQLVNAAGVPLSPYATVTDGVPDKFSDLRVIVDEKNNTFSIYVDGDVAYYEADGKRYPFIGIQLPALEGNGVTAAKKAGSGFTGDPNKYYDYTREYAEKLLADGVISRMDPDYEYIAFFQWMKNFYLEEIALKVIPDSAIEYVGVQERVSENTFDLRFLAALDDIYVENVGFMIDAYYNGQYVGRETVFTEEVYKAVSAGGSTFASYQTDKGVYLTAVRILGIERTGINNTYTLKITPYVADEEGYPVYSNGTYTIVYNGEGQCLNSGFPMEVPDIVEEETMGSPAVIVETTKRSASKGDYADFYVYIRTSDPSGRYYTRYNYMYEYSTAVTNGTNSNTNIDSMRVRTAQVVKLSAYNEETDTLNYAVVEQILQSGEVSLAIKENVDADGDGKNDVLDFCGGYHGDEHITSFTMKIDGEVYNLGEKAEVICCSEVTLEQISEIDRWEEDLGDDGKKQQVLRHEQYVTFNRKGVTSNKVLTWLVDDFEIYSVFPSMYTLNRTDAERNFICEHVELYDANGKYLSGTDTTAEYKQQTNVLSNVNAREARYSSATTGFSAGVKVDIISGAEVTSAYIAARTSTGYQDNKWYFNVQSAENGKTPKTGEVWEFEVSYYVDYVAPTK